MLTRSGEAAGAAGGGQALRIVLLHQHQSGEDDTVAGLLQAHFAKAGHTVFVDRSQVGNMDWAWTVQREIEQADAVVPLLSAASVLDEALGFEVLTAHEVSRRRKGRPQLLPVRIGYTGPLPEPLAGILSSLEYQLWEGPHDDLGLVTELEAALGRLPAGEPPPARPPEKGRRLSRPTSPDSNMGLRLLQPAAATPAKGLPLEPVGGAVPLKSAFYITRPTDAELLQAVRQFDSLVLIKGARQMGKTSLLARGLQAAREQGARVALTDFQEFSHTNLESPTTLYMTLGESLVDQLGLSVLPSDVWDARRGANVNFDRFMRREVLGKIQGPLVWGLDEVDRLLVTDYATEVFGLFRAWHNQRALDPAGPWTQLTTLIAYATEAHLFISDLNQSPFNVGTRLTLEDFTLDQVTELNERHGRPLKAGDELNRFFRLVGGHPFLVRRGLQEIAGKGLEVGRFESRATADEGIFSDHLKRILMLLARDQDLLQVVRDNLLGNPCNSADSFYRLRSAGVMSGASPSDMRPRCHIYMAYLRRHLL